MEVLCLDLEGVLTPEIWIELAERTGIDELRKTTRDVADYDELMAMRLGVLERHGLGIDDIQAAIADLDPLPGARAFLDWARERFQICVLSDTFYEFSPPLMRKLGWPLLLCHHLEVDAGGRVTGYRLRQRDQKRKAVRALKELRYRVLAAGDSFNDIAMLEEADLGVLFRPSAATREQFTVFDVAEDYDALRAALAAGVE